MKNTIRIHSIICLSLLFSCQSVDNRSTEQIIKKFEENSTLIKEVASTENGFSTKIQLYETKAITKIAIASNYEKYIDINQQYYKNDTMIIAEIVQGITPIIYKKTRETHQPIGELVDKIIYFESSSTGIEKRRELKIYENDDVELLKSDLLKKDYEIRAIGTEEYIQVQENFEGLLEELN